VGIDDFLDRGEDDSEEECRIIGVDGDLLKRAPRFIVFDVDFKGECRGVAEFDDAESCDNGFLVATKIAFLAGGANESRKLVDLSCHFRWYTLKI